MKLILAGTAGWIVARFVARRLRNGRLPPHTFVPKVIERNADSSTNTTVMDCKRSKLLHLGWRKSKIHLGAVTVIHALHSSICLSNKSIHVSPIDNCLAKFYNVSINKERHPRDLKINTGVSGQTHEESDMSNLAHPTQNAKSSPNLAVRAAAVRMAARHPQHTALAARALAVAESGRVEYDHSDCAKATGSHGEVYLMWLAPDGPQCSCPSWQHRPAVINNHRYCKHLVAWVMLNQAQD